MFEFIGFEQYVTELYASFKSYFSSIWLFLNSQFALTFFGTLVSAFAGVYGAHTIIERNKRRDELQQELRTTNTAIMVSFEICNSFLALKKQHVRELGAKYNTLKDSAIQFKKDLEAGKIEPNNFFHLQVDFKSLNPMTMPIEILI